MANVNVVKIGYYDFTVDDDFLSALLSAVATGKIQQCEKKYVDNRYIVTSQKRMDVSSEYLEIVNERDAELQDLRARLKKLEG